MTPEVLQRIRSSAETWGLGRSQVAQVFDYIEQLQQELYLWRPLTPEEAEKALDEAEAEPISKEAIDEMVRRVTDPAAVVTNTEWAQMGARIRDLEQQLADVHSHVKESLELLGVDVSATGYVPDSWTLREQCKMAGDRLRTLPADPQTGGT